MNDLSNNSTVGQMSGPRQRIEYFDYAKGLAILLMLLSHSAPGELINGWLFSFHMPLFFIVGGAILGSRYERSEMPMQALTRKLRNRFSQLIIPYFVWGSLIVLFFAFLGYAAGSGFNILPGIISLLSFGGVASLWFIPDYLLAEIIVCVLLLFGRKGVTALFLLVMAYLAVATLCGSPVDFPHRLNHRLHYISIFAAGYLFYPFLAKMRSIWGLLLVVLFSLIHFLYHPSSPALQWLSMWSVSIGLTIGSLLLFRQLKADTKVSQFLTFFGRNSIILLCTNNIIIETIRLADYKLAGNMLQGGPLQCMLFFTVLVLVEYWVVVVENKNKMLRWTFGK